ncbi:MAG: hypothetical protein ACXVRS_10980 [Gaiellaceae bacterium]
MVGDQTPDTRRLRMELEQLEAEEREISTYRRRLHDRIDRFPSEAATKEEREVSDKRRALHRRIDELRALLDPDPGISDDDTFMDATVRLAARAVSIRLAIDGRAVANVAEHGEWIQIRGADELGERVPLTAWESQRVNLLFEIQPA